MDLLIKNGNLITMNAKSSTVRWIAVRDGKIAALSERDDYPEAKDVIDLEGKTILPGFIDSHIHGTLMSLMLDSINFSNARSIDDVLDLTGEACRNAVEDDELITGFFLEPETMKEKRWPTRWELDRISGNHPVFLNHVSLHAGLVNSKALEMSQVPFGQEGVLMDKGQPTGAFTMDIPYNIALRNLLNSINNNTLIRIFNRVCLLAASKGITTIHSLDGFDTGDEAVVSLIKNNRSLSTHLVNYWQTWNPNRPKDLGLSRVGGCIFLDGSRTMYTMALNEPYHDRPYIRGSLYQSDKKVYQFVSKAHEMNMQISMHAIGDRAIDQLIYTLKRVVAEQGVKDLRHRIEHFSLPSNKHIEIAAELGIVAAMQPAFAYKWGQPGGLHEQILGKERANKMESLADVWKRGVVICGGSDCPVTMPDPLLGIQAAVNNPSPDKNIPLTEAIKLFTINGAYAAHEDKIKGSIEIGKLADLVVIEQNPYFINLNSIGAIDVLMTIVKGKIIFKKEKLA